MRIRARHYATGCSVDVLCAGSTIQFVENPTQGKPDYEAAWIAPALFDLQINGCDGYNFGSEALTIDAVRHVIAVCRGHGIGAFCPTLVTNAFPALAHGLKTLRQACEADSDVAS